MTPSSAAPRRTESSTSSWVEPVPRPVPRAAPSPASRDSPRDVGRETPPASTGAAPSPQLPDPAPLATNLARCVFEILAGAREIEQIARWVTDDVYRHLMKRVVLAARARSARGESAQRPAFSVGTVRVTEPGEGVAEAVVIIHGRARSRAVALRLESFNNRWRATAVHVL